MKMIRLGAIMALVVGGQALGQTSKISYTLELGGNNHASGAAPSWENPTACVPPAFTSGSTSDGQSFAGPHVTWAARVFVTGTHSNTFAPSGAANLVANLELRSGSATGELVATFGHGSPTAQGWFSTVNDGDGEGTRSAPPISGGCGFPADPLEDAAFAVGFDIESNNPPRARVIDAPVDFGPFLDYFMYPSTAGHPAGSTATGGTLLGVGAGYSRYAGYGCPSDCGGGNGLNTAGVGKTGAASCGVLLGNGPIFEGQLNTSGLSGTYVLVLVPGSGNNIVNGNFLCDSADPGAFALAPDLASEGDTITFTVGGPPPQPDRTIIAWRSVRTHNMPPLTEFAIPLSATATGNGTSGPTVETRGPNSGPGIQKIQLDFNGAVTLANAANIVVTRRQTTPGAPATMGGPVSVTPTSVTMEDADTMTITFAALLIPNMSCVNITIGAGTIVENLQGDADVNVRSLYCDMNRNGTVDAADQLATKGQVGQPVTVTNCRFDANMGGTTIQAADQAAVKGQLVNPARTALCP